MSLPPYILVNGCSAIRLESVISPAVGIYHRDNGCWSIEVAKRGKRLVLNCARFLGTNVKTRRGKEKVTLRACTRKTWADDNGYDGRNGLSAAQQRESLKKRRSRRAEPDEPCF